MTTDPEQCGPVPVDPRQADPGSPKELRRRQIAEVQGFTAKAVSHLSWTRGQVLENQTRRLREVVAHAQSESQFHAARLRDLDASRLELCDLSSIPPMTKADVMEGWDDLVTDKRLKLAGVTEHLEQLHQGEKDNYYYLNQYYAAATGGTSGKRGVYLWDWETVLVTSNINYRMEIQQDLLHPTNASKRTAVICAGSYVHASRLLFPTMLDSERDVLVIPADTTIKRMIRQLNDYQPDRLVGYASIIQELCAEALDGNLRVRPNRISTNSEQLLPEARQMAEEAWGINIHNSWGSVEVGLAATEGASFGGCTLAEDFLIVESVDAHNQLVADPSKADHVLVTKLYGSVMPLIRYEMTDTLVIDDNPNPDASGYRRIVDIKGRSDSWFIYSSQLKIHPMVFRSVLGQDSRISEYQVIQTERGARVLAITHRDFTPNHIIEKLTRSLADAGLVGAEVSVESVTELPRHAQTNKLKRFVPMHVS